MFWVTQRLGLGAWPGASEVDALQRAGITHVLNVAGRCSYSTAPFVEACSLPVVDLRVIPTDVADACLRALLRMATHSAESRIYVHCAAGQNRSPTILWLFLIACGLSPDEAESKIANASFDSIPGHPSLVDEALVAWAIGLRPEFVSAAAHGLLEEPPSRSMLS